ncbi:Hpt domain-containing protein [bacterium]|nr:Hpt domain-containing protein [bacterium]
MTAVLLDVSVLLQSCGGDEDFARELFGEYQQRVNELVVVMHKALQAQQPEEIRKAAHELKGSSLTLGATEMAHISRTLEDGIKAGQTTQLNEWVTTLETQAGLLFAHLKTLSYLE